MCRVSRSEGGRGASEAKVFVKGREGKEREGEGDIGVCEGNVTGWTGQQNGVCRGMELVNGKRLR